MYESFDPQRIALAVTTYYPNWYPGKLKTIGDTDKVRGDLALEFIKKVILIGYRLVIVDNGSSKEFLEELKRLHGICLFQFRTEVRGVGKRLAIDKAREIPGVEVIVLVEPEKVSFITECVKQTEEPILQGNADIVIPKRNEVLFNSTYPRYMYDSEIEGNSIYNKELRSSGIMTNTMPPFDWFFGPRVFRNNEHIVSLFKRNYQFSLSDDRSLFGPDQYSNILYFPIINALKENLSVLSVEVPFAYPAIQKENENIGAREDFMKKRNLQRMSILSELKYFIDV